MPRSSSYRYALLWLTPLLLVAAFLGSRWLTLPLWFDEAISIYNVGGGHYGPLSPAEILARVAADDFQTPAHYLALAGWGALVGWSELAGRWLSLLFGLLTIALVYRLGRDLFSVQTGVAAAATIGLSAFFANYMHEMRAYTLAALFTALVLWAYWGVACAKQKPGFWTQAALVLGVAGLFYTHYFASLTAVGLGAYHLLFAPRNGRWWRALLLLIVGGALFIPWLGEILLTARFLNENEARVRPLAMDTRAVVQTTLHMFSNGGLLLLALIGLFALRIRGRAAGLAWFTFGFVLLASLAINARFGVLFAVRHIMGLWPILALLAGIGIDRLARAGVSPVYIIVLWLAAGVWNTFDPASYDDIRLPHTHLHWNALADALRARAQDDDRLVFLLPYPAVTPAHQLVSEYYLHGLPVDIRMMESPRLLGDEGYRAGARDALGEDERVWVAYDPNQLPDHLGDFDRVLIDSHTLCGTVVNTPDLHLNVYAPNVESDESVTGRFGEGVTLRVPMSPTYTNRYAVSAVLRWSVAPEVPPNTYSFALHVLNRDGALVAQHDEGLPGEGDSCRSVDLALPPLPAGEYTVNAIVYNWQSGERLPATSEDTITIGYFAIGD